MKKIFLIGLMIIVVSSLLVGCKKKEVEPSEGEMSATISVAERGPVPFSDVHDSMLDSKYSPSSNEDGYMEFTFKDGAGTCIDDEGMFTEFSYLQDEDLGYFVVKAGDDYMDDYVSLDFIGNLRFNDVPLTSGSAICKAVSEYENDDAALTCYLMEGEEEVELCTGSYKVWAVK